MAPIPTSWFSSRGSGSSTDGARLVGTPPPKANAKSRSGPGRSQHPGPASDAVAQQPDGHIRPEVPSKRAPYSGQPGAGCPSQRGRGPCTDGAFLGVRHPLAKAETARHGAGVPLGTATIPLNGPSAVLRFPVRRHPARHRRKPPSLGKSAPVPPVALQCLQKQGSRVFPWLSPRQREADTVTTPCNPAIKNHRITLNPNHLRLPETGKDEGAG